MLRMKRAAGQIFAFTALCLLWSCSSDKSPSSSEPIETWQKTFGGSGVDYAFSVAETGDGGYIAAGYTESYGDRHGDVYLVRADESGNLLWEKAFGGEQSDYASSVIAAPDGGYVVAGASASFGGGDYDVYVIKADSVGDLIWHKWFGGAEADGAQSIEPTSDGGYIIVGTTFFFGVGLRDVYLIKIDSQGNLVWETTFGGDDMESASSVKQISSGGYIVGGSTSSFGSGSSDIYLVRTDASGNLVWQKTFGGEFTDFGGAVVQSADGGYIIAGDSYQGTGQDCNFCLIKTNSSGTLVWQKFYGGEEEDDAGDMCVTADGGYVITGLTRSFGVGSVDAFLVKTDASGTMQWQRTFGGADEDITFSVAQTRDGGYILAGSTESFGAGQQEDMYLVKTDASGKL